jgi:hypothetical protein
MRVEKMRKVSEAAVSSVLLQAVRPCTLLGRFLQILVYNKFRAVRGGRRQLIASVIAGTEWPYSCQVTDTAMERAAALTAVCGAYWLPHIRLYVSWLQI